MARDPVVNIQNRRQHDAPAAVADIRLEAQVIGAVLYDNNAFRDCAGLTADAFTDDVHREVWAEVCRMIEHSRKATPATLAAEYGPERLDALGGREMFAQLVREGRQLQGQLDTAVRRLRDLTTWRMLENLSRDLSAWVHQRPMGASDAVSALLREADSILQSGHQGARSKKEVARAALQQALTPVDPTPTGIESLDYLMHGGLTPMRVYGIGGETGYGKTILLGSISENLNFDQVPHLHISLETPSEDIELRNVARRLGANAAQIHDREHPEHNLVVRRADAYLDQVPDCTFFEWAPGATIDDIRRFIVHARHRHGIQGAIIDYWQLIKGREKGQSEEGHLREVANKLAEIARREGIWIIVAVQIEESGRIKISDSIKQASSLYIRLVRVENDTIAHFRTEKSNYTRYADTGSSSIPGMVFRYEGPHFATPGPEDLTESGDDAPEDAVHV